MSYTALARRYRSSSFDEVVGQEPIARTLRAAIEQNRVAHAYLFCGTRGVGKTTMARLFAKALNAPGDQPPEVARAIMEGRDTDVVEIDAASNRGVDEARDLIANCVYRPMRGPYKIYIIDEVHMLTREAFNALLKTMEEPPEHVKFILCTTETHKVPATIQSRCQRFDFRNIETRQIARHLEHVVKQEGVQAEAGLLTAVARLGAGSMRDALSLLDRLMASGEKKLTTGVLEDLLGLPSRDVVDEILIASAGSDPASALTRADALLAQGVSIDQAIEAMLVRLRDVMVLCACGGDTGLVELEGEDRERAASLASQYDAAGALHMIALCENVQRRVKDSSTPRALFDALIVRLAMTTAVADVARLLAGDGQGPARAEPRPAARTPAPRQAPASPPPAPARRAPAKKTEPAGGPSQAAPAGGSVHDEAMREPIVRMASDLFGGARVVRIESDTDA